VALCHTPCPTKRAVVGVACQCDKMLAASISLGISPVAIALLFASGFFLFYFYLFSVDWRDALKYVAAGKKCVFFFCLKGAVKK